MRPVLVLAALCLVVSLSTACAFQQRRELRAVEHAGPVNCATAHGDLRVLKHEKANVVEQIEEGVTAIYPASMVIGILTLTEGTKLKVAIDDYNKIIDKRIEQIRETCGIDS